jgi:hypothetical protein
LFYKVKQDSPCYPDKNIIEMQIVMSHMVYFQLLQKTRKKIIQGVTSSCLLYHIKKALGIDIFRHRCRYIFPDTIAKGLWRWYAESGKTGTGLKFNSSPG